MALPSNPFRPNPPGSTDSQIIRAIVYMLDIMPYFSLKQGATAVELPPLLVSEMNSFSGRERTLVNYFSSIGIQLRPADRFDVNNVRELTANQTLFETR